MHSLTTHSRRSTWTASIALLVGLAIIAISTQALGAGRADAQTARPTLAVLAGPVSPGDEANAPIVNAAKDDPTLQVGASRRVAQPSVGSLWIIPTSDGRTCLGLEPDPSVVGPAVAVVDGKTVTSGPPPALVYNCQNNDEVSSTGILTGTRGRVVGYAPDGTTTVTATDKNGAVGTLSKGPGSYIVPSGIVSVAVNGVAKPLGFATTAG